MKLQNQLILDEKIRDVWDELHCQLELCQIINKKYCWKSRIQWPKFMYLNWEKIMILIWKKDRSEDIRKAVENEIR